MAKSAPLGRDTGLYPRRRHSDRCRPPEPQLDPTTGCQGALNRSDRPPQAHQPAHLVLIWTELSSGNSARVNTAVSQGSNLWTSTRLPRSSHVPAGGMHIVSGPTPSCILQCAILTEYHAISGPNNPVPVLLIKLGQQYSVQYGLW